MIWHSDSKESILTALGVTEENGLSSADAAKQQAAFLREQRRKRASGRITYQLLRACCRALVLIPLALCAAAAGFAIYHSSRGTPESMLPALITAGLVLLAAILRGLIQFGAHRSLSRLPKGTGVTVTVRRDHTEQVISDTEVTAGDILLLHAGDFVPADCRLLSSRLLICDETACGGDAHVQKNADDTLDAIVPLANRTNMIYAGSVIITGECVAVAVETDGNTEWARVRSVASFEAKPLEADTALLRRRLAQGAYLGAFIFLLVALFAALPLTDSLLGLAAVLSLGCDWISPVWLTIYAAGLRAGSKHGIVFHAEQTLCDLAATQRIALDKYAFSAPRPATLTDVYAGSEILRVSGKVTQQGVLALLRLAALCTDETTNDPLDDAILACAAKNGITSAALHTEYPVLNSEPFSAAARRMAVVRLIDGQKLRIVKGAPSALFPLCDTLPDNIEITQVAMRERGLQVLAVAYAYVDEAGEEALHFAGLLGFMLAKEPAVELIASCHTAHILPCMMTGDDAVTAHAYAVQIGLIPSETESLDRAVIDTLSDAALSEQATSVLYTDLLPSTRARLLRTWKQSGVCVLGSGIHAADRVLLKETTVGAVCTDSTPAAKGVADLLLPSLSLADQLCAIALVRKLWARLRTAAQIGIAAALSMVLAFLTIAIAWRSIWLASFWILGGAILACGLLPMLCGIFRVRKYRSPVSATTPYTARTTVRALIGGILLAAALVAAYVYLPVGAGVIAALSVWIGGSALLGIVRG